MKGAVPRSGSAFFTPPPVSRSLSRSSEIVTLAGHLPDGPAYAAVRAPIAEGGGYAWFANRGIGRPVAESLAETMSWFRSWLDDVAPEGRPVLLVGQGEQHPEPVLLAHRQQGGEPGQEVGHPARLEHVSAQLHGLHAVILPVVVRR